MKKPPPGQLSLLDDLDDLPEEAGRPQKPARRTARRATEPTAPAPNKPESRPVTSPASAKATKAAPSLKPKSAQKTTATASKTGKTPAAKTPQPGSTPARSSPPPPASTQRAAGRPSRTHRIIDLRRPHNTNTLEGALEYALHIVEGADAYWQEQRQKRLSDAELEAVIGEAFMPGEFGYRAAGQKGFTTRGGPHPEFWWGGASAAAAVLKGAPLVARVRGVLNLATKKTIG